MSRRSSREHALQFLYGQLLNPDIEYERLEYEELETDKAYSQKIIAAVNAHAEEIDAQISMHSHKWSIKQMNKVDVTILRMSVAECLYVPQADVNKSIVINEALELARQYSGDESVPFINGILNAVL